MKRLPAIDVARGIAVVCMVLHHTVDSWVVEDQRHTLAFAVLRHFGGIPAPGFMFLAGLSSALVAARERDKGATIATRAWTGVKRGLYILGIAFVFRIFCFVAGGNHLDGWPMLFRVDILNCMGAALALVSVFVAFARTPRQSIATMAVLTAVFGLSAPYMEPMRFHFPSDLLGNYIMGDLNSPLVLFPLFPWLAYLSVGYLIGEVIAHALKGSKQPGCETLGVLSRKWLIVGPVVFAGGLLLTALPFSLYPPHDYWHSSPLWVASRLGVQVTLLAVCSFALRHDVLGRRASFLQLLGRHSLLAYFAHVELVYGRATTAMHRAWPIPRTLCGVAILIAGCGVLALAAERFSEWRRKPRPPASRGSAPEPAPSLPEAAA